MEYTLDRPSETPNFTLAAQARRSKMTASVIVPGGVSDRGEKIFRMDRVIHKQDEESRLIGPDGVEQVSAASMSGGLFFAQGTDQPALSAAIQPATRASAALTTGAKPLDRVVCRGVTSV